MVLRRTSFRFTATNLTERMMALKFDAGPRRRTARIRSVMAWVDGHPPPGPFRPGFWRSPIRGPWLTSVLGALLLVGIPLMFLTGLLDFLAYNPWLPGNGGREGSHVLTFVPFHWPTRPAWLFRVTQGLHVTLGVVLVPVLVAKLWSVIPKLFEWPSVRSPAHAAERASLFVLVGGAVFTFVTGLLNVQYWYRFPGSFYRLHYYGAWVFMVGFTVHACLKVPKMRAALRARKLRDELRVDLKHTTVEPYEEYGLVSRAPAAPTVSRRGALGLVAAGSASLLVLTVGQSIGGPLRRVALLAPRGGYDSGDGPNDFVVNIFAADVGVRPAGEEWRLEVHGAAAPISLRRADLLAMPQYVAHLPIACVEGWSVPAQRWEGVRLRDLARLAGVPHARSVFVESLQADGGEFARGRLADNQIADRGSLLALRVNGADLSLDHGWPARIIVPDNPGVRNTKWVRRLTFEA
jgi:DMSO/TMAO reductase YedYZ molybdopterin-dependent catalytic subunit